MLKLSLCVSHSSEDLQLSGIQCCDKIVVLLCAVFVESYVENSEPTVRQGLLYEVLTAEPSEVHIYAEIEATHSISPYLRDTQWLPGSTAGLCQSQQFPTEATRRLSRFLRLPC